MAKNKMTIKNVNSQKEYEVTDREWEAIAQNSEVAPLYVVTDPVKQDPEVIIPTTKP